MTPIYNIPAITPVVDPLASGTAASGGATQANGSVASGADFTQLLTNAIGSLSGLQTNADQAVAGLATNQGVDIHQAMLAMDQASLGMSLAVQVRNKAVESYQTLINMQM